MALEVVEAFGLEHVRWITPLEDHALRAVKGAAIGRGKAGRETQRIYDLVAPIRTCQLLLVGIPLRTLLECVNIEEG